MPDDYMKNFELPEDRSWVLVAENCRNVGIQFQGQGQAHVHIGKSMPTGSDAVIIVSNLLPEEPRTASFGQLPDDAKVYMRRNGSVATPEVTILAY